MNRSQSWETCRIGSCHRHQECMYAPCRNEDRPAKSLEQRAIERRVDRNQPWRWQ